METRWHCIKGIVKRTMTMSTRAGKKDALGFATKRAEKLLEEEEAVLVMVKETAEGARDAA